MMTLTIRESSRIAALLLLVVTVLCGGCSDEMTDAQSGSAEEQTLCVGRGSGVCRLPVAAGDIVYVKGQEDWLTETTDDDGTPAIYVEENSGEESRRSGMKAVTRDGRTLTFRIEQAGRGTDKAIPDSYERTAGVGWGYDCNTYFGDTRGVRDQIFNPVKIKNLAEKYQGELLIEDEPYDYVTSTQCSGSSSTELSNSLGVQAEVGVGIPFAFSLDVKARFSQSDMESGENSFATNRLRKVIKRRVMSVENIIAAINNGDDVFTNSFKMYMKWLSDSHGDERLIREFVNVYGNCFTCVSEVGGRLDYDLTVKKSTSVSADELEIGVSAGLLSVFSLSLSQTQRNVMTKIQENSKYSLTARGGDVTILGEALLKGSQGDSVMLTRWQESVNESNAQMVSSTLTPIWEIIADTEVRAKVRAYITGERIEEEDFELPAPYISCSRFAVPRFGNDGTQVKVGWADGCPAVEFCHEYIPVIDIRQRVTVAYPIVNNKPVYDRGLFVGNDGRFPPGEIEWSNGRCYYHAISGMEDIGHIDSVFVEGDKISPVAVEGKSYSEGTDAADFCISYYDREYPVVKVGRYVWMRTDLMTENTNDGQYDLSHSLNNGHWMYGIGNVDGKRYLPVNWELPGDSHVDALNSLTNTSDVYIDGEVSGLDVGAILSGNKEEYYIMMSGGTMELPLTENVRKGTSRGSAPIRGVRSETFRYH